MQPQVLCLGAINLELTYRVDDIGGFMDQWGAGLARGGEAALSPREELRLQALLDRRAQPAGRQGGGQAANTAFALARLGAREDNRASGTVSLPCPGRKACATLNLI